MTIKHQSATSLAEGLDRKRIADERHYARNMAFAKADLVRGLEAACLAKARWVVMFSEGRNARPAQQIEEARRSLGAMQQALDIISHLSDERFSRVREELVSKGVIIGATGQ